MSDLPPPIYIDTTKGLVRWVETLEDASIIAVDTESDSFFSYREKVCLIQMSANGKDVLIDTLALPDIEPLREVFEDPGRTKVFHDAGYDLICLGRDYGFRFQSLFDTMLASRLLGRRRFGLAAVLMEHFEFEADKGQQRSDWGKRPLTSAQIQYARYDTHFLPQLTELLAEELRRLDRWEWAVEDFARLPIVAKRTPVKDTEPDPHAFWRVKGVKGKTPEVIGRVRALQQMRERLAQRLDRPPFKVFGDAVLVDIAVDDPHTLAELGPRKGLGAPAVARFGRGILQALDDARPVHGKIPAGSGRRRRTGRFLDPEARARYEALRETRRVVAEGIDLEPDVLLSNAPLETLARKPPRAMEDLLQIEELCGWRRPLLLEALFEGLQKARVEEP